MSRLTMPDGAVYETAPSPKVEKGEWDGITTEQVVIKSSAARQYTLSVGYAAYASDVAVARDGHIDFASEEEIEKAAWDYLASGPAVGLKHADGSEGAGKIVESYIYRGPDWNVEDQVIKSGDWLIGTIWSDEAWAAIERGEITGTSMQGSAKRRTPNPADVAKVKARRG